MKFTDAQLKQIYAHARESYPRECFGFLVGTYDEGGLVHRVARGTNLNTGRTDRFEMDPSEFVGVERQADAEGLTVIGFYHSHPDWPAIPSQTDIDWAWEGSYYLIVSVYEGRPLNTAIWMLAEQTPKHFIQEPLEILDGNALTASGR
ncbi:MAG: M67 family metallopeptidase [Anaerolineae bacterium]